MAKASKILAGRRAQHTGNAFEQMFETACYRQSIQFTRVPDSCKQLATRIIRIKSPFDYIITYQGVTAVIDTKTKDADTFPNSMIDEDQVNNLAKHDQRPTRSGYVVYLRKAERIIFIPVKLLANLIGVRGSVDQCSDGVLDLGNLQGYDLRKIFN